MKKIFLVIFALFAIAGPSLAVEPDEVLKDPALEARARALSSQLRCLVCQNQSIDDSDAALAKDLRILLRERLKAGDTDEQAIDYLVNRFGEFVLLKPRFALHTLALWLGPFVLLIIAGFALSKRRKKTVPAKTEAELSDAERQQLESLLDEPKA